MGWRSLVWPALQQSGPVGGPPRCRASASRRSRAHRVSRCLCPSAFFSHHPPLSHLLHCVVAAIGPLPDLLTARCTLSSRVGSETSQCRFRPAVGDWDAGFYHSWLQRDTNLSRPLLISHPHLADMSNLDAHPQAPVTVRQLVQLARARSGNPLPPGRHDGLAAASLPECRASRSRDLPSGPPSKRAVSSTPSRPSKLSPAGNLDRTQRRRPPPGGGPTSNRSVSSHAPPPPPTHGDRSTASAWSRSLGSSIIPLPARRSRARPTVLPPSSNSLPLSAPSGDASEARRPYDRGIAGPNLAAVDLASRPSATPSRSRLAPHCRNSATAAPSRSALRRAPNKQRPPADADSAQPAAPGVPAKLGPLPTACSSEREQAACDHEDAHAFAGSVAEGRPWERAPTSEDHSALPPFIPDSPPPLKGPLVEYCGLPVGIKVVLAARRRAALSNDRGSPTHRMRSPEPPFLHNDVARAIQALRDGVHGGSRF
ncbi:hypothetical protein FA95DRAFT_141025 [Auriscalpium vulgare]|uniref:Uncharacterized protein n=1 Tax=Auriscalpium vulgare TaxID=40419 RepID=A0ACB8S6N5_9AGAM|nr:hypothetical protein FA95DRAFT_141025 [Auriscalpium vulgare]